MNNKVPCSIIRDIAPLYADDLVTSDTKTVIEEHIGKCDGCRRQYGVMMEKIENMQVCREKCQVAEIDVMKKINTYQKSNLVLGAIISFLFGLSIPIIKVGVPVILGNGITEYHLARLQAKWQIVVMEMIISGVIVCTGYLGMNRILKKKRRKYK